MSMQFGKLLSVYCVKNPEVKSQRGDTKNKQIMMILDRISSSWKGNLGDCRSMKAETLSFSSTSLPINH